ncbi:MAG: hypothetical protein LIP02_11475 [Bacteroidales bacterium]|nr:hypothetical protein [Bacteroidales bacterium]
MAKLGYILVYDTNTSLDSDRKWMRSYGCQRIVEETFKGNSSRAGIDWRVLQPRPLSRRACQQAT